MRERIICRCEELLYRLVIVPLVAFLPAPLAYGLACLRGDLRYRLDRFTRTQIISNLAGVLGDQLSQAERARVARDFFRQKSCQAIDGMRLAGRGRALARLVEIRGLEHLERALAAGKGAVLCDAHFGSIYCCASLLGARGFPITAVGNTWSNPIISLLERLPFSNFSSAERRPRHLRRPNIEPRRGQVEAAIAMAEILRANEVICIAIDVPVAPEDRAHAVPVDFLGREVLLLPGSVGIAQHTGSPVLVAVARRSADWRHQVLEISPVPPDGDVETVFKRCVAMLEAPIRQNLAEWEGCQQTQTLVEFGLLSVEEPREEAFLSNEKRGNR
jgi:lauroyl/myristoyl acyltransferase